MGWSEIKDGRPVHLLVETFSTSLKTLNGIQRNMTGSKNSMSSTEFLFFGTIGKSRWPPGLWLAETFSSLKPLSGIKRNLTGSKISTFVFLEPIGYPRWPPWPLIGWGISDFFSDTAERNLTKLHRKQDMHLFTKFVFFGPIGIPRWPPWYLIVFQDGHPGIWLVEASSLQPLNRIQRNLTGSKIPASSTKCFFLIDWKIRMTAIASEWLRHCFQLLWNLNRYQRKLIGARSRRPLPNFWGFFFADGKNKMPSLRLWLAETFSSETDKKWNSTKLVRKQDFNILCQVCVFEPIEKPRWPPGLWFDEIFSTSVLKPLNRIQRNLTTFPLKPLKNVISQNFTSTSFTKFVFFGPIEKPKLPPALWFARAFRTSLWPQNRIQRNIKEEARSQCRLPSFCFSGRSKSQDGRLGLWLAKTFWTSSLKQLRGIHRNLIGSKISTSSSEWSFWADWKKQDDRPAYCWLRHFRLLCNRWIEFNELWQEASSQHPPPSLCFGLIIISMSFIPKRGTYM